MRLAKYFNKQGIFHPDDMSGIILTSYWRYRNKESIDLPKQITFYQGCWRKVESKQEQLKDGVKPE